MVFNENSVIDHGVFSCRQTDRQAVSHEKQIDT